MSSRCSATSRARWRALQVALTPAAEQTLAARATKDLAAYDAYLRAQELANRGNSVHPPGSELERAAWEPALRAAHGAGGALVARSRSGRRVPNSTSLLRQPSM